MTLKAERKQKSNVSLIEFCCGGLVRGNVRDSLTDLLKL